MGNRLLIAVTIATVLVAACRPYRSWGPLYEGAELTADALSMKIGGVRIKADLEETAIWYGVTPTTSSWGATVEMKNYLKSTVLYDITQVELRYSGRSVPATGWSAARERSIFGDVPPPLGDVIEIKPGKTRKLSIGFKRDIYREKWEEAVVLDLGNLTVGEKSVEIPEIHFKPTSGPQTF